LCWKYCCMMRDWRCGGVMKKRLRSVIITRDGRDFASHQSNTTTTTTTTTKQTKYSQYQHKSSERDRNPK
jgi:hypothetical protein